MGLRHHFTQLLAAGVTDYYRSNDGVTAYEAGVTACVCAALFEATCMSFLNDEALPRGYLKRLQFTAS